MSVQEVKSSAARGSRRAGLTSKRVADSLYPQCNCCPARAVYRIEVEIEQTDFVFVHFACEEHLEKELNYLQRVRETYPYRNARVTVINLLTMERQGFVDYGDGRLNGSTTDEDVKMMQEEDLRVSEILEQLGRGKRNMDNANEQNHEGQN